MKKILVILLLFIILLSGCKEKKISEYPSSIALNGLVYSVTVSEVSRDDLGKQLGEVKRIKKPMPVENEESNFISVGSKVFEIKGIDIKTAVAVEDNGKIKKAFLN